MAQPSAPINRFPPPNITEADLQAFHAAHFSSLGLEHFSAQFLGPVNQTSYDDEEEEDGKEEDDHLGYYPDGVKRTLTDEQIAMFRHSEIQALLRAQRHAEENGTSKAHFAHISASDEAQEAKEDGEVSYGSAPSPTTFKSSARSTPIESPRNTFSAPTKDRKAQNKRGTRHQQQYVKPDLRKRTWDKVDRGLHSLEYEDMDEDNGATEMRPTAPQRRRISYDDV